LRKIGVCVLHDDRAVLLKRLTPPVYSRGAERLTVLRNLLQHALLPWNGEAAAVAFEAQSLGSVGDLDGLGQINGVVQIVLKDLFPQAQLYSVPPAVLKKFVAGHSGADKGEMMRASAERWGFDFTQYGDDVCDAHGLARIAQECTEHSSTRRHEIEAAATAQRRQSPRRRRSFPRLFPRTI
jgi:Holliday junction resolvasome RuvABC endonuclease subunit